MRISDWSSDVCSSDLFQFKRLYQGVKFMDAQAATLIGAGLAAIGAGMAAIGVGNVFGSFLESALRNPAAADGHQGRLFIGFAAAALLGLLSSLIALLPSLKAAARRRRRPPGPTGRP